MAGGAIGWKRINAAVVSIFFKCGAISLSLPVQVNALDVNYVIAVVVVVVVGVGDVVEGVLLPLFSKSRDLPKNK